MPQAKPKTFQLDGRWRRPLKIGEGIEPSPFSRLRSLTSSALPPNFPRLQIYFYPFLLFCVYSSLFLYFFISLFLCFSIYLQIPPNFSNNLQFFPISSTPNYRPPPRRRTACRTGLNTSRKGVPSQNSRDLFKIPRPEGLGFDAGIRLVGYRARQGRKAPARLHTVFLSHHIQWHPAAYYNNKYSHTQTKKRC